MPKVEIKKVRKGSADSVSFYGQVEEFMKWKPNVVGDDLRHSVFICGAADSGKSFACCWRMHLFALKYPGVQILMCRKNATALRNSAVITYQKVLKQSGYDKIVKLLGKSQPDKFIYPYSKVTDQRDGRVYEGESIIVIGNLDRSSDHLGAEYDMSYVNQPEEITLEDWEYLMSRTSGRKGGSPYSILMGDPNPAHEQHWIKKGFDEGRWKIFAPSHEDNPELYDHDKQQWTSEGIKRVGVLQNLSGHTKDRLLYGKWVNTEGLVYGDVWNTRDHVKSFNQIETSELWPRYVAIDFGYTAPTVMSLFAENPSTGILYRTHLIYRTQNNINENGELLKKMLLPYSNIKAIVCDRDPDSVSVLQQILGRPIQQAKKGAGSKDVSTDLLIKRLKDNKIVFIETDEALFHERDLNLEKKKLPTGFPDEVMNIRYDNKGDGTVVKENDHECFTEETEVLTDQGWKFIKDISNEEVMAVTSTGEGFFEKPLSIIKKSYSGKLYSPSEYTLDFKATENHSHAIITQMNWAKKHVYKLEKRKFEDLSKASFWPVNLTKWEEGSGHFKQGADEAWFAGFWLAEGCFNKTRPYLIVYQSKEINKRQLRENLSRLGWVYSESKDKRFKGAIQFSVSGQKERVARYRKDFGEYSHSKKLSIETIFKMTKAEREAFWDGYMAGDGCRTNHNWHYDSVSKDLIDGIQILTMSLGYDCRIHSSECMKAGLRRTPNGFSNSRKTYRGSVIRMSKGVVSINKKRFIETEVKNEMVYCVETSTAFFLARTNGKPFVAGNCDAVKYLIRHLDGGRRMLKVLWR